MHDREHYCHCGKFTHLINGWLCRVCFDAWAASAKLVREAS